MAEASDKYGMVLQNLTDAGCDDKTAEKCTEYILSGKYEQALALIGSQKKHLLEIVRTNQKRIDCLDFLAYKIGKSEI